MKNLFTNIIEEATAGALIGSALDTITSSAKTRSENRKILIGRCRVCGRRAPEAGRYSLCQYCSNKGIKID